MLPPFCRRWLWTWLPAQWSEPQVTRQCGTPQPFQEEMRTVTGSASAFSGHFSCLRVLFCGGFGFSDQNLSTLVFQAFLDLSSFYFVSRSIYFLRKKYAGKGCQRSAVFYFIKIPPEKLKFSCDFFSQEPKLVR